jgi:acyl-CoA synthetase (AMP-forming)/AMP-acid ligase II
LLAELRAAARASLADYKAPDRLVLADSLPLTSMMKVDKRRLAEQAGSLPGTDAGSASHRPADPAHNGAKHTNGAHAS